jgi:putative transposase
MLWGKQTELQTPHALCLKLGMTLESRLSAYRELFKEHTSQDLIDELRKCTNSGTAFASERFIKEIESLQLGRVSSRDSGRPRSR